MALRIKHIGQFFRTLFVGVSIMSMFMSRRRLLIIIGIAAVVLIGVAVLAMGVAFGHTGQTSSSSLTPTPSSTTVNKPRLFVGVIQSLSGQSFVLALNHKKKTVTVLVNDRTKYSTPSGTASFGDLQVGQMVQVRGRVNPQDQTVLALSVRILPPTSTVTAINGQTLTLTTTDGKTVTVNITSTTVVYVGNVPVSTKAIAVGQTIGYEGTTASDGSVNADKLWLTLPHARGTVTAITSTTVTLQLSDGTTVTIGLSPNTTYVQGGISSNKGTPTVVNVQAVK